MKIKLLTGVSDNAGFFKAGETMDVSDAQGQRFIAAGIAEPVNAPQAPVADAVVSTDKADAITSTNPVKPKRGRSAKV